jgi:hypothetical protein
MSFATKVGNVPDQTPTRSVIRLQIFHIYDSFATMAGPAFPAFPTFLSDKVNYRTGKPEMEAEAGLIVVAKLRHI